MFSKSIMHWYSYHTKVIGKDHNVPENTILLYKERNQYKGVLLSGRHLFVVIHSPEHYSVQFYLEGFDSQVEHDRFWRWDLDQSILPGFNDFNQREFDLSVLKLMEGAIHARKHQHILDMNHIHDDIDRLNESLYDIYSQTIDIKTEGDGKVE